MADDFGSENLEDGELWLPPNFFSMDEAQVSNNITTPFRFCSSSKPIISMEGFQRIYPSTFFQRQHHNCGLCMPLPYFQRFKPAARYGFSTVSDGGAQNTCDRGSGKFWTGCSSIHQLRRLNPVHTEIIKPDSGQVQCFMAERARALQGQQQNRFYLNRISPRLEIGARGGTGVFLPRE
ncbi:hypothetical protein OROHE_006486 [Orobanche hederae]